MKTLFQLIILSLISLPLFASHFYSIEDHEIHENHFIRKITTKPNCVSKETLLDIATDPIVDRYNTYEERWGRIEDRFIANLSDSSIFCIKESSTNEENICDEEDSKKYPFAPSEEPLISYDFPEDYKDFTVVRLNSADVNYSHDIMGSLSADEMKRGWSYYNFVTLYEGFEIYVAKSINALPDEKKIHVARHVKTSCKREYSE